MSESPVNFFHSYLVDISTQYIFAAMVTDRETGLRKKLANQMDGMLVFNINQVAHLFAKKGNRELTQSGVSLQVEQLPILIVVSASADELLSQQDIANLLQKDKSGIQRSIRTLERDGYLRVVADSIDRRKNLIQLTPAGRMVVDKVIAFAKQLDEFVTSQLEPEEIAAFTKVLTKIARLVES